MKPTQLSLFPKTLSNFGGSLLMGKRKSKRPLSSKSPIHLIIKSEKARAALSFVSHQKKIQELIYSTAKKYHIRIYDKAINFNHVHVVLQLPHLPNYSPWIRELTAKIVIYLQAKTTQSLSGFFTLRPFTRIITWGRDFKSAMHYQVLNQMEVFGLRPKPKKLKKRPRQDLVPSTFAPPGTERQGCCRKDLRSPSLSSCWMKWTFGRINLGLGLNPYERTPYMN